MTETLPDVDVVILTWNDGDDAAVCAASAVRSTGVRPHVLVVDNGSTIPFSPRDGISVLRFESNLGVAGGRNCGIRAGNAPYVAIVDSDAVLDPSSLERLLEPLLADPAIGMASPVFVDVPAAHTAGRHPSAWRKLARGLGLTRAYGSMAGGGAWSDVEFTIGACQVFRRSLYDEVGGIEPQGLFGPEDVEFCRQIRLSGSRIVQVRGTGVSHEARRAWRSVFSRRGLHHLVSIVRYYIGSSVRGRRRHPPR